MRTSLRYLRITWTVACGIACVLLIVLWARSYLVTDVIYWRVSQPRTISLESSTGRVFFTVNDGGNYYSPDDWHVGYASDNYPIEVAPGNLGFGFLRDRVYLRSLQIPIWFLAGLSGVLAATPWIRWFHRFSLRTLLIATTLVAMMLGLLVWAVH
jgi:hypothetical protein